jgi:hypothetical protein
MIVQKLLAQYFKHRDDPAFYSLPEPIGGQIMKSLRLIIHVGRALTRRLDSE